MTQTLTYRLHDVSPYINWIYFFHAWGFPPRFAGIAQVHACAGCRATWLRQFPQEEQERAQEAVRLYDDACRELTRLDETYRTYVRFGLYEANADADNLILWDDATADTESQRSMRLPLLRQQQVKNEDYFLCLSDFVRPLSGGIRDRVGVFCATVDSEMEHLYESGDTYDPYLHMLCQTLADRLAEASVEKMHQQIRTHYWGYAPDEQLSIPELLQEHFQGIRPAVGYPSLPDQSTNFDLDSWLHFDEIGLRITETGAMIPHASVSGLILAHPQSHYFAVGKIGTDQLEDYARRKGQPVETIRKFLAANL